MKQPDVIGRLIFARAVARLFTPAAKHAAVEIGGGRSRRRDRGG